MVEEKQQAPLVLDFGHNVKGWVEKEGEDEYLHMKVRLKWDGETLTKKLYPSIAGTTGRRRLYQINENGDLEGRQEFVTMAVWGMKGLKKG